MVSRLRQFLSASTLSLTAFIAVFLLYEGLIFLRAPKLLYDPRFISEDGAVFYQYALKHHWVTALFAPHMGYYSLFSNLSTVLAANFFSIENAPILPTLFALIAQLCPCFVILTARGNLFDRNWKRLFVLAIVLFAPASRGIWLSVHTSLFHFGITGLLLLLSDPPEDKRILWLHRVLLFLCGLNGLLTAVLLPFFALRAMLSSREAKIQLLLLTISVGAHLFISMDILLSEEQHRARGKPMHWLLPLIFNNNLVLPFVGWDAAKGLARVLAEDMRSGGDRGIYNMMLLSGAGFVWLIGWPCNWRAWLLLGSFLGWSVFCYRYATIDGRGMLVYLHPAMGARYYYMTVVCTGLLLMASYCCGWFRSSKCRQRIKCILLIVFLLQGASQWVFHPHPMLNKSRSWREEVALWRVEPERSIRLWGPAFQVRIPRKYQNIVFP